MLFKNISVLKEDFSAAHGMDVRTEGAYIVSVKDTVPGDKVGGAAQGDRVIDGSGKLLMPGFFNAHTHVPMTLLRGYGENMILQDWLEKKVFPFEEKLTGEDCYYATMLAMAESFANGIVSSSDHYFYSEDIARAAIETGAKMNISRGLSFFDEILELSGFRPIHEARDLFYNYHDTHDGRIRVDIGLHSEYTATPDLMVAVADLLSETGAKIHVHVSETRSEHEESKERNGGKTPVQTLAERGIFCNGGLAAHCVWIEEEDADILFEKGVSVVSCPVSNLKLASGIARVPLLMEKGLNIALGTDGTASNNNLNFFESMKLFSLSAKVRFGDPTLVTPAQALYSATKAGALAQDRPDCGCVAEGFHADLIVIDLKSPAMNPVYEMANALVFAASNRDILMTVADGQVVYENGGFPTIDIERAVYETEKAKNRILSELASETQ